MADRIFPNNIDVDMGSKISFSGIDWNQVKNNIENVKTASPLDKVMDIFEQLTGYNEEQLKDLIEEAVEVDRGGEDSMPSDDMNEEAHDISGDESEEDEEESAPPTSKPSTEFSSPHDDEEVPADDESSAPSFSHDDDHQFGHEAPLTPIMAETSWKMSAGKNTMKKIAFTHPDQISAAAIEKAIAAGDQRLVNTILAARKENRNRIASAIEAKLQKQAGTKTAQEFDSLPSDWKGDSKGDLLKLNLSPDDLSKVQGMPSEAFTSPNKFTAAQRDSFKKIALAHGFPKEYINSMLTPVISSEVTKLNNQIKEVYSSRLDDSVKPTLVQTLIKEAKLSGDSKSEFIDYWNKVLGYQDKEFWPLVAADYENGKKVK